MKYETYTKYRDKAKKTDSEVARAIPILATATLYEWKKGTYKPKLDKQLAIAKLLNIPMSKVVEEA